MIIKTIRYKDYSHRPPIVWLDTNVVIGIRDALSNTSKQELDKIKFLKLYKVLKEKVDKNEIICPFSGQRTEYSDGDHIEESDNILLDLSKGFQVSQWQLRQVQVKRILECFLKKEDEFYFSDSDLVYRERETENIVSPFKIVILNEKSKRDNKELLFADLERRKREVKNLGMTYDQVYKSEYDAAISVLQQSIDRVISKYGYLKTDFTLNDDEYHHLYTVVELSKLADTPDDKFLFESLKNFFSSEYFYSIPIDRIRSAIVSHIMTEGNNVSKNDIGDIDNLSSILPYASYILTENRMAHILKTRNFDSEFGVDIFRFDEIDKFIEIFEK